MSSNQAMRALRILGLALAAIAAVVVFVVGGRDGGQDWQVPALVLTGVLALILGLITAPYTRGGAAASSVSAPHDPRGAEPGGVAGVAALHGAGPHHLADPSAAEVGPVAGLPADAHGLPGVVVPASSFPDAGHSHGPVIAVHDQAPPPPLHAVLAPPPAGAAPPPPAAPGFTASSPDSVMVDLRPESDDPMVTRLLDRPPPVPGDRADVAAPAVGDTPPPPPPPPPPPASPPWAPPPS